MNKIAVVAILLLSLVAVGEEKFKILKKGGDKIIVDKTTKLMWTTDIEGKVDLLGAIDKCSTLTYGGFTDWRIPKLNELRTIVEGCQKIEPNGACQIVPFTSEMLSRGQCSCWEEKGETYKKCFWNEKYFGKFCEPVVAIGTADACQGACYFVIDFSTSGLGTSHYSNKYKLFCVRSGTDEK
ncbi:MAG TPA: DUF1566 domain-containing protein [bacterium]|nr:DUF1566 domain-containing protein [bacterium]